MANSKARQIRTFTYSNSNSMENIFLTGFMGAGKTTVAAALAKILNRTAVDLDALLEDEFGCSITNADAATFHTVGDVIAYLEQNSRRGSE